MRTVPHSSRRFPGAALSAVAFACVLAAAPAEARDFYVDFGASGAGCSDANPGTDRNTPWCSVPGTRTANDSGWLKTQWGSGATTITQATGQKLTAGDTIWIKGGTTHSSARGGRLVIGFCGTPDCPGGGEGFWANGTAAQPIQIRNGAANPTPWGSGAVTWNCSGMAGYSNDGCVSVIDAISARGNWVWIRGKDANNRIVIKNGPHLGLAAYTDNNGTAGSLVGFVLEFFDVSNNGDMGINIVHADSATVKDGLAHDNGSSGVAFGLGSGAANRTVRDGTVMDVEAYNNGTDVGNGNRNGFNCFDCGTAAQAAVFLRGKTHNNGRDGADNGLLNTSGNTFVVYLGTESYDNGEDGFACNGDPSCNGCSTSCSEVGVVSYNNPNSGTCTYETGTTHYITQSVIQRAAAGPGSDVGCFGVSGVTTTRVQNTICYQPADGDRAWSQCGGASGTPTRQSVSSIYIPKASDSELFIGSSSYDSNPGSNFSVFTGNKLGITSPNYGSPALFRTTSNGSYAGNDYHPSASNTAAIDSGTPYCAVTSANGSGTTFSVSCDPRRFFFSSVNRPFVPSDVAFVGSTNTRSCTVVGMTATSVTCSASIGWSNGEPVARVPVTGSAPDIGLFEYGTGVVPPDLLSVDVVN